MITPRDIVPVILAGGAVTGLWPLASASCPPPFLRLDGAHSFFQKTVLRTSMFHAPIILCQDYHRAIVTKQLSAINVKPHVIITEPCRKGTAAAIALAAFHLKGKGKIMLVMPSDHVLCHAGAFRREVVRAMTGDINGMILFGAPPRYAEKSYGYISYEAQNGADETLHKVTAFREKPTDTELHHILSAGNVLWNTGIFLAPPQNYLDALQERAGDIYRASQRAYFSAQNNGDMLYPQAAEFAKMPESSVEEAVFARGAQCDVVRVDNMQWSDAGTWTKFMRAKLLSCR